jgi:4-hydroxybenzoate polyprenyltransferase
MFNKPYLQVFNILILYPIGFFYCHPKIRLRNRIFFDWIIHSIWPACVFAIIYFFYFSTIDLLFGIYFIFGLFFGLFAQIENQIRDFEIDKTNNDNNTTQFIGIIKTNNIRILLMFVITFCLIIIFYLNNKIIPILIIIATLLIIPLTKYRGKDFKLILVCWVIIYVISDIFSL